MVPRGGSPEYTQHTPCETHQWCARIIYAKRTFCRIWLMKMRVQLVLFRIAVSLRSAWLMRRACRQRSGMVTKHKHVHVSSTGRRSFFTKTHVLYNGRRKTTQALNKQTCTDYLSLIVMPLVFRTVCCEDFNFSRAGEIFVLNQPHNTSSHFTLRRLHPTSIKNASEGKPCTLGQINDSYLMTQNL